MTVAIGVGSCAKKSSTKLALRPPCSGKQRSCGFLLALGGTRAAKPLPSGNHFPFLVIVTATPSLAFTAGPWTVNCDLISTPTGSVAQILPCEEENANAKLIAQAPTLLSLVRSFQHDCKDRISILKEDRAELCGDETDDIDDQIGHWSVLLEECDTALAAVR